MTNATETPSNTGRTLGQIAIAEAIKAVRNDDSAAFAATVALGLIMVDRQITRAESDKDITAKANKATFRAFLKEYANKGGLVWRDTQHAVDAFMAKGGKERRAAASDYIDKKAKGSRLVDGLAKLKTWSFRLMEDVCVNHASVIRDMIQTKASGAGGDALAEKFREFVKAEYGTSFAALTESLAKEPKAKEAVSVIDSIMKRAADMTDSDLALLVAKVQWLYHERQTVAAEVAETFASPGDASPELIPAAPEAVAA